MCTKDLRFLGLNLVLKLHFKFWIEVEVRGNHFLMELALCAGALSSLDEKGPSQSLSATKEAQKT